MEYENTDELTWEESEYLFEDFMDEDEEEVYFPEIDDIWLD